MIASQYVIAVLLLSSAASEIGMDDAITQPLAITADTRREESLDIG